MARMARMMAMQKEEFSVFIREIRGSIPSVAAGRCAPLSRPLWGDQTIQVSNHQGIAKIRGNVHFSVDFIRIKAYYSIVRMEKAKAQSNGGGTKDAKTEMPCLAILRNSNSNKILAAKERKERRDKSL
jgi:hypothetical protein